MTDLAARVLAAIEETERIARGDLLTSADPEPPPGTTVELFDGQELWTRHADMWPGSWLRHGFEETGDPETWTKVAGNYGPARVIRLDRDTVLRRCAADRKIVEECRGLSSGVFSDSTVGALGDLVLSLLAEGYGLTEED